VPVIPVDPTPSGGTTPPGGRSFRELTYQECLTHLGRATIGRLAVVVGRYPQVFPVNYRLDDFVVVFRTDLGTKLLAAQHANVAFEVDNVDQEARTGWSVLIQGMAEDVSARVDDAIAERGRHLDIDPWAPGDRSRVVRIIPASVSGREIRLDG
jgi:nitroimidazol reductase NimA-like FMN-containing flavoprotein (pyridoxamine 5'-phosphate oxidase superfamily)